MVNALAIDAPQTKRRGAENNDDNTAASFFMLLWWLGSPLLYGRMAAATK
jgi:hypothetical protein